LRRSALIAFGILLLAAVGALLLSTRLFAARTIEVSGFDHLDRAHVIEISGITDRTNIVRLDTGAIEERIERDPWVETATVTRSLPSTVRISITERHPVALLRGASGFVLLATDGAVLDELGRSTDLTRTLPTIRGVEGSETLAGGVEAGQGAGVAGHLPPLIRRQVRWITVASTGAIDLALRSGVPVVYGSAEQADVKGQILRSILAWADANARTIESIDLRTPEAPTARLQGKEVAVGEDVIGADPDAQT
jgi:cell division protein FtsQ